MADSDGLMEQLTRFLGSEEGMKQLQSAAQMLGLAPSSSAAVPEQKSGGPETLLTALSGMGGQGTGVSAGNGTGMDPQTVMKLTRVLQTVRQETPASTLLKALRPLLREERRGKVDEAIRMMQLFSLLPLLREAGGGL